MRIGRRALLEGLAVSIAARSSLADELLRFGGTPQELATPTAFFERLLTPTNVFFVRSHFGAPSLDRTRKLSVAGEVKTPLELDAETLAKTFKETTVTAVLQCAGNGRALHKPRVPGVQWVHGGMGQATFTGVRLKDVLEKAGIDASAVLHVRATGADAPPKPTVPAFVRSVPLARALDPSTLIATKMNGEPLTLAHGAPLRLVLPGWCGDHWVKWLTSLRVQKEEADGFYMQTAYRMPVPGETDKTRPATTFPVKSIIGAPADGAKGALGPQHVVGIAFSGDAPIKQVEVSIDGGTTWTKAKLEGDAGAGRAQVFRHDFDQKTPATLRAMSRATDAKGNTQPKEPAWNPSGYFWNGWHEVTWSVA